MLNCFMKHIYCCLILISFIVFFPNSSYSQVSFGIKSGMNIATTKDLLEFPKNRIGLYGGIYSLIPLNNKFSLDAEILYSSKGQRTNKIVGAQDESVTRLNYLNILIKSFLF